MQEFSFVSPRTIQEVCRALAQTGGRPIAGGTDVIPHMLSGRFSADWLVDLSHLEEVRFICPADGHVRVGALTTFAEIVASPLLQSEAPLLVQAAATVGSVQTRHRGTLGGNIGNASPAGDSLPPLLALDAEVALMSVRGERALHLADLLQGPGKTGIAPDEVIHYVSFPHLQRDVRSLFLKLGNRQGMAVSVASVALVLQTDAGGRVEDVRIALGAVAPTAIRCAEAEQALRGRKLTGKTIEATASAAAQACSPIDDVRATAGYRRHAVRVLVRRGLTALAKGI